MPPANITDPAATLAKDGAKATGAGEDVPRKDKPPAKPKAKETIRVSPAVLDAAGKDGNDPLRLLRTRLEGLTQAEAEDGERKTGQNVVAQETRRGWFLRVFIILRNPLLILLAALSSISFATGDARAGSVMAAMVMRSAALRFFQEARADAAAATLKAMIQLGSIPRSFVSDRLVRRIDHDADTYHPYHPRQQDSLFAEQTKLAVVDREPIDHGRRSVASALSRGDVGWNRSFAELYWLILLATLFAYSCLTQGVKVLLLRRKWI